MRPGDHEPTDPSTDPPVGWPPQPPAPRAPHDGDSPVSAAPPGPDLYEPVWPPVPTAWPVTSPPPGAWSGRDPAPVTATPPGPDLYRPPAHYSAPGSAPPGPDLATDWSGGDRGAGPLTPDGPGIVGRLLRRLRGGA
ncbi:hypothetical protein [Catellatospora methionotrophica]|uniref:hypothetical protein n=1 Tax=Catellatospora methionotrophica TaxID=121620 RepID=UPI0034066DA8